MLFVVLTVESSFLELALKLAVLWVEVLEMCGLSEWLYWTADGVPGRPPKLLRPLKTFFVSDFLSFIIFSEAEFFRSISKFLSSFNWSSLLEKPLSTFNPLNWIVVFFQIHQSE